MITRSETLGDLRQRVSEKEAKTAAKAKELLAKGKDLSFSDIQWLLNKEVSREKIKKALKMPTDVFTDYLVQHGIPRVRAEKKEGTPVKKPKGDIELAKKLLRETDLTVQEIAKKTGTTNGAVYYHKKRKA